MKKFLFILFWVCCSVKAYPQAGDLYVGAKSGYITYYKSFLYGPNVSYDISRPLQISFSGLMNPNIERKDEFNPNEKITNSLYSANLDARFFFLNMESFSLGISLGAQYLYNKRVTTIETLDNSLGMNIGFHLRVSITDNVRMTGGWRYSTLKDNESYNLFYVGIGYAFNLY